MTIVIVSLGAIGVFAVERDQNSDIKSVATRFERRSMR
jgi:hypothetical protein